MNDTAGSNPLPWEKLVADKRHTSFHSHMRSSDCEQPKRSIQWSAEEDALLCQAVAQCTNTRAKITGGKPRIDWKRVGTLLPNRTAAGCSQRWRKCIFHRFKRGQWTREEDELLKHATISNCKPSTNGVFYDWKAIAKSIPGRSVKQCKERWMCCLNPLVRHGKWSQEEDELLLKAFSQCGPCWSEIAKRIQSRNATSIRCRWNAIKTSEMGEHAQRVFSHQASDCGQSRMRRFHSFPLSILPGSSNQDDLDQLVEFEESLSFQSFGDDHPLSSGTTTISPPPLLRRGMSFYDELV